jgi:single-strand DNA-binding protein
LERYILGIIIEKSIKRCNPVNNVSLTGRLTRDSELMDFTNGKRALKFTLAVERNFKNAIGDRDTDFLPVIYFTDYADRLIEYLTKGKLVSVTGRISVRSVDGADGSKKYFTDVVADSIDFLGSNKLNVL